MHRIYFTAVPLASNFLLESQPIHPVNFRLDTRLRQAAYPIVPILESSMRPGDTATVVAVRQTNDGENPNRELLRRELEGLNLTGWTLQDLTVREGQDKDLLLGLFGQMIGCIRDDACYYACMTFGTKTYPVVLFSALAYAEKIRRNTQVCGIYYQEILRQQGRTRAVNLYDVTALFTLNSLVDMVAEMDCTDKDGMIRRMLEL